MIEFRPGNEYLNVKTSEIHTLYRRECPFSSYDCEEHWTTVGDKNICVNVYKLILNGDWIPYIRPAAKIEK